MRRTFQIGNAPLTRPPYFGLVSPGVCSIQDLATAGNEVVLPFADRTPGSFFGWGVNIFAGLALNNSTTSIATKASVLPTGTIRAVYQPGASAAAVQLLTEAGDIWSAGFGGTTGRFGNNTTTTSYLTSYVKAQQPAGIMFVQSALGANNSYAIDTLGDLYYWGTIASSGVASGAGNQLVPLKVASDRKWKRVVAGPTNTVFAIDQYDLLWAGGSNTNGLTGLGVTTGTTTTLTQVGTDTWLDIDVASQGAMAINMSGHLFTWGSQSNNWPVLGNGMGANLTVSTPTRVTNGVGSTLKFKSVNIVGSLTASHVMAAIDENDRLWMWGANTNNVLGDAASGTPTYTPRQIHSGYWKKVRMISSGAVAALDRSDRLFFWGNQSSSGLGNINASPLTSASTMSPEVVAHGVDDFFLCGSYLVKMK